MQEFFDIHKQRKAYPPESEEGHALYAQLIQWIENNYVIFPCTGPKVVPTIVNKALRNTQLDGAQFEHDTYLSAEGLWYQS